MWVCNSNGEMENINIDFSDCATQEDKYLKLYQYLEYSDYNNYLKATSTKEAIQRQTRKISSDLYRLVREMI